VRSAAYYRGKEGRMKKRALNRNRYLVATAKDSEPEAMREHDCEEPIVEHVRMVVSLIEGRRVRRDEVVGMLKRISRQHSLTRRRRFDYLVQQLNKGPP
jgi:hypothetical protein